MINLSATEAVCVRWRHHHSAKTMNVPYPLSFFLVLSSFTSLHSFLYYLGIIFSQWSSASPLLNLIVLSSGVRQLSLLCSLPPIFFILIFNPKVNVLPFTENSSLRDFKVHQLFWFSLPFTDHPGELAFNFAIFHLPQLRATGLVFLAVLHEDVAQHSWSFHNFQSY